MNRTFGVGTTPYNFTNRDARAWFQWFALKNGRAPFNCEITGDFTYRPDYDPYDTVNGWSTAKFMSIYGRRPRTPLVVENIQFDADQYDMSRSFLTIVRERLAAKFDSRVRKITYGSTVDMLNILAEGYETVDHLTHRITQLASVVHSIKKGHLGTALDTLGVTKKRKRSVIATIRSGKKAGTHVRLTKDGRAFQSLTPKKTASLFLELKFGIEPLIQDVQDLFYRAMHQNNIEIPLRNERVSASVHYEYEDNPSGVGARYESHCQMSVDVTGRVVFDNPMDVFLRSFGLDTPLAAVWEVVPFSFVIDWFVKVQDFLASLTRITPSYKLDVVTQHVSYRGWSKMRPYRDSKTYRADTKAFVRCANLSIDTMRSGGNDLWDAVRKYSVTLIPPEVKPALESGKGLNTVRLLESVALLTQVITPVGAPVSARRNSTGFLLRRTASGDAHRL